MPHLGVSYMLAISALSLAMHAEDKLVASGWLQSSGRVPEIVLHQVELVGGSPGSFLAQRLLWHKISKVAYQTRFSLVLLLQMAAGCAWGYLSGPSIALAGMELASAVMFTVTAMRIRTLNNQWKHRLA